MSFIECMDCDREWDTAAEFIRYNKESIDDHAEELDLDEDVVPLLKLHLNEKGRELREEDTFDILTVCGPCWLDRIADGTVPGWLG